MSVICGDHMIQSHDPQNFIFVIMGCDIIAYTPAEVALDNTCCWFHGREGAHKQEHEHRDSMSRLVLVLFYFVCNNTWGIRAQVRRSRQKPRVGLQAYCCFSDRYTHTLSSMPLCTLLKWFLLLHNSFGCFLFLLLKTERKAKRSRVGFFGGLLNDADFVLVRAALTFLPFNGKLW